jgi:hypothetical protein
MISKLPAPIASGVCLLTLLVSGCSATNKAVITQTRNAPTGVGPKEGISVLLTRYAERDECKGPNEEDCWARFESEDTEKRFDRCLIRSMAHENSPLRFVPGSEFRRLAFPGATFLDSPRSPESVMPFLVDSEFQRRIASLSVRYLVLLDVSTSALGRRKTVDGASLLWVVKESWARASRLNAVVLDIKGAIRSGEISADASEGAGVFVPFVVLIPLPPVWWSPATESSACAGLGKAVADFIMGEGQPDAAK